MRQKLPLNTPKQIRAPGNIVAFECLSLYGFCSDYLAIIFGIMKSYNYTR